MVGKKQQAPDFYEMPDEELIAWRVAKKAEIIALREELRASNVAYNGRIRARAQAELLRRMGLPEGTTIITPASAELATEGQ